MKKPYVVVLAVLVVAVLAGLGWYMFGRGPAGPAAMPGPSENPQAPTTTQPASTPTSTPAQNKGETIIGQSVEGRDITAYHFGTGSTDVLFLGGIHGGYEWNTSLVAYELMDYLRSNPAAVPANVRVTVIPTLNPDGLNKVVSANGKFSAADITASQTVQISGRFNAHNVDLNRNFDCDWQPNGKWQSTTVSGGSAAFSEPESMAIKNYIEARRPSAVVVWYSSAGGVFSSSCHDGVLPETDALTGIYSKASGYPGHKSFDFYATTGDMTNWLAKIKVPAISVLLTNHTDTEWSKNQAGIDAVLKHYAQ